MELKTTNTDDIFILLVSLKLMELKLILILTDEAW
jgi:hypothetical protein